MQSTTNHFKIEKKTLKSLKIIGLQKNVKTNGYDSFGEDPVAPSTPIPTPATPPPVRTPAPRVGASNNLNDDPRLSSYSRNNLNPDSFRAPQSPMSKTASAPKEEVTDEMRSKIKENMDFMKNLLKLYQVVKGPMKKQALVLQDYNEEHYHKMVFGFQVETFEGIPDDLAKLDVPEGEYFTITLATQDVAKSPDMIKDAWKHLKDEISSERSFAFDFQVTDPIKKTITFYAQSKSI
jgi:predicted transcriptional regulator YdeE